VSSAAPRSTSPTGRAVDVKGSKPTLNLPEIGALGSNPRDTKRVAPRWPALLVDPFVHLSVELRQDRRYREDVAADPRKTLRDNLEALMKRDWGAINKRLLAQKAQIAETTVQNILGGVNRTRIDMVDRLAGVFKLPAWRLLKPDVLEADQERISDQAMEIGQLFDKLPGDRRPRAHTLIVQLLELRETGTSESTPR